VVAKPDAHVVFPLDVDKDGWPPVEAERVWAFDLGQGGTASTTSLGSAHDLAIADVVAAARHDADSQPVLTRLLSGVRTSSRVRT
jgi:hypothetical protein